MIANCEFQMFYEKFASEKRIPGKWRRQECDYSSNSMNNRIMIAMDRLACSRSASSRYRKFFSWRIKRSMWTLHQAFADRSTYQVYLWAITHKLIFKSQMANHRILFRLCPVLAKINLGKQRNLHLHSVFHSLLYQCSHLILFVLSNLQHKLVMHL